MKENDLFEKVNEYSENLAEAEELKERIIEKYGDEEVPVRKEIEPIIDYWKSELENANEKHSAFVLGHDVGKLRAKMEVHLKRKNGNKEPEK